MHNHSTSYSLVFVARHAHKPVTLISGKHGLVALKPTRKAHVPLSSGDVLFAQKLRLLRLEDASSSLWPRFSCHNVKLCFHDNRLAA
jgi:hypothetical protein